MSLISQDLLERLAEFDTALLANTIGVIDPTPVDEWYMGGSIQSVTRGLGPTTGIAYTCELDSSSPGGIADTDDYWRQMEEMDRDRRPCIWVVKTVGSRPDHECVLGDGMAKALHSVGCRGVVTDGGVRDVAGMMTVPFAAYSRGLTIHHGLLRFSGAGKPVEVGGITIRSGDIVHADGGGVIRIPAACAEGLPAQAVRMQAFERDAHMLLRRTDLKPSQKRQGVADLLKSYNFQQTCLTSDKSANPAG